MIQLLPDIQKTGDKRGVDLEQVGICDLCYPITVFDQHNGKQHTTATIKMSVSLPHHVKGTHMSRFIEVFNHYKAEVSVHTIPVILEKMKKHLDAEVAHIELQFPYFLDRKAPFTGSGAPVKYHCTIIGEANCGYTDIILGVDVQITSLCPCSKEISLYGAHNQRGNVSIKVNCTGNSGEPQFLSIEELISIAEDSASAPLYTLLKRSDERVVTMQAYDNPAFVEDITREVAVRLKKENRVKSFSVKVTNFESIHNHNAFASTSWRRK
jgi:GTP cyclohydrolase IB